MDTKVSQKPKRRKNRIYNIPLGTVNKTSIFLILYEIKTWLIINHTIRVKKTMTLIGKLIIHQYWRIKRKENSKKIAQRNLHYSKFQTKYPNDQPQFNPYEWNWTFIMGYLQWIWDSELMIKIKQHFNSCQFLWRNKRFKPQTISMDHNHQSRYCRELYSTLWWESFLPNPLKLRSWIRKEKFKRETNFTG